MPHPTSLDRPPRERALAWLYTGPLGQLWAAVADLGGMWVRWQARRLAAKLRDRGSRSADRGNG